MRNELIVSKEAKNMDKRSSAQPLNRHETEKRRNGDWL